MSLESKPLLARAKYDWIKLTLKRVFREGCKHGISDQGEVVTKLREQECSNPILMYGEPGKSAYLSGFIMISQTDKIFKFTELPDRLKAFMLTFISEKMKH